MTQDRTEQFATWSRRLQQSDPAAHDAVFEALHAPLLRYAIRWVRNETLALDVVQQTFMKLWDFRHRLDPKASLEALLYRMVKNTSIDHLRKKERMQHVEPLDTAPELPVHAPAADDLLEADDLNRHLTAWIEELPTRRREAFLLSRFHGLKHQEISEVMGISAGTVNLHVLHALQHIRQRLDAFQNKPTSP